MLYVGRVSKEKNISAFLDLPVEGTKYVVGDGPMLPHLQASYLPVQLLSSFIHFSTLETKSSAVCMQAAGVTLDLYPTIRLW